MTMIKYLGVEKWGLWKSLCPPLVVAGPCSAETEEQVYGTATALKAAGIGVFRAGLWKPRTHPASFEGVGERGLPWLVRVQRELGMRVATEVANAHHVEQALRAGLDLLWLGARTTANPFAVQEIADALQGTDIPVLVKNPVNPDLELWLGALERLERAGICRIGAVHRGFSAYGEMKYRMDLGFDGLMVESHVCPEQALSDAAQQLTPAALGEMLAGLVVRQEDTENPVYKANIDELRSRIDAIDNELVDLLGLRMEISAQIGEYKKQNNITILQTGRWEKVLERVLARGAEKGLDAGFLERIFTAIHRASIDRQSNVMQDGESQGENV